MPNSNFKTLALLMLVLAIGITAGWFLAGRESVMEHDDGQQATARKEPLYWVAPMDQNFRRDKPGKSPMGMDLIPVYEEPAAGSEPGIRIDPAVVANLGMKTAVARAGQLMPKIETVGYVEYDERGMTMVHTRAEGWIDKLHVSAMGDPVEAGQALFELFSPKLVSAQREYLTALGSDNELLIQASRERLKSLGLSEAAQRQLDQTRQVRERIVQYAPQSGVVETLAVREGMFVTPGAHTLTLADLDTAWVQVEIFERDAGQVSVGQPASARLEAYPGEIWEGTVDYVYPEVDPMTRTVRVRLAFSNKDLRLKPNMFVRASIRTDPRPEAVLIPSEALIRSGRGARVVVSHADERFEVLSVKPGMEAQGEVEILDGLEAGQQVVKSAQFLIDSEANIGAESARIEGGDAEAPAREESMPGMEMQP